MHRHRLDIVAHPLTSLVTVVVSVGLVRWLTGHHCCLSIGLVRWLAACCSRSSVGLVRWLAIRWAGKVAALLLLFGWWLGAVEGSSQEQPC